MGTIYRERNEINGKCYIGKSRIDAVKRSQTHRSGNGSRLLKQAIAKYGIENFTFEILHDGILDIFLDGYEIEAIKEHDCVAPNGYNLTYGGEGGSPSEATRRKISETKRGSKASNETRQKMSEAHKGKVFSKEHRSKLAECQKGRTHSKEHRRKHSEAIKGRTPWNKNKTGIYSAKTLCKMSEAHKGRTPWNKGKIGVQTAWNKGKKGIYSEETRRSNSETKLGMSQKSLSILIGWLLRDGWAQSKIAKELGKSETTIRKYKP